MRYNRDAGLEEICQELLVYGYLIEPLVWDYVLELLTTPEHFEERIRQAQMRELENMGNVP